MPVVISIELFDSHYTAFYNYCVTQSWYDETQAFPISSADYLAQFGAKTLIEHNFVTRLEFKTPEDLLYFKLKFN